MPLARRPLVPIGLCIKIGAFVFNAYDAYYRRPIHSVDYAVTRRMPVRLPVTRRYCIETAIRIIKLFSPSASHMFLVFPYQTLWQYPHEAPPHNCPVECRWGIKIQIFDQYIGFISEMIQHNATLTVECRQYASSIEWCPSQWPRMTSMPDFKVTPLFDAEHLRNGTIHSYNVILTGLVHQGCNYF